MSMIAGFVKLAASLIVILFSLAWLTERYEITPNPGIFSFPAYNYFEDRSQEGDGVSAEEDSDVFIPASPFLFHGPRWEVEQGEFLVLPVSTNQYDSPTISMYASGSLRSFSRGASCGSSIVNLLVVDQTRANATPMFDRRVYIASFMYLNEDDQHSVIALVVYNDTNGDGRLDCGDEASLERISLPSGEKVVADNKFVPDALSRVTFDSYHSGEIVFVQFSRESDRVTFKSYRVNPSDLSIKVTDGPDLLAGAQAAFDNR